MLTDTSPPFRINRRPTDADNNNTMRNNKNDECSPSEAGAGEAEQDQADGIRGPSSSDNAVQLMFGRAPDRWLCSAGGDFSVLTFEKVAAAFRAASCDKTQTALVVHRLTTHVSAPNQFRFGADALRVLRQENAGGASEFSEAISFEVLARTFGAQLERTEMEIEYEWGRWSKRTDFTCRMFGLSLAVSVTRAMKFHGSFTRDDAFRLLSKKLLGVRLSNRDVVREHRWHKQVLHILTAQLYVVELLREVYCWMMRHAPALVGDTVVLITHTVDTPFLYFNFCADQTAMQFVCENEPPPSRAMAKASQRTFTTAAMSETARAGPAAEREEESSSRESLFWYGYPTLEEARAHKALPEPLGRLAVLDSKGIQGRKGEKGILQRLWPASPLQPLGYSGVGRGRARLSRRLRVGCLKSGGMRGRVGVDRRWQQSAASVSSIDVLNRSRIQPLEIEAIADDFSPSPTSLHADLLPSNPLLLCLAITQQAIEAAAAEEGWHEAHESCNADDAPLDSAASVFAGFGLARLFGDA